MICKHLIVDPLHNHDGILLHLLVLPSGNDLGRMLTLTGSARRWLTLKPSTIQVRALGYSHVSLEGKVQICILKERVANLYLLGYQTDLYSVRRRQ